MEMGVQEGLLVVLLVAALVYIIRYIKKQYNSGNAGGEDICEKCGAKEVAREKRRSQKPQDS